jgi:hypothetical protein
MVKYLIKERELPNTVGMGLNNISTRYFLDYRLAEHKLSELIQFDRKKYKKYDVYATLK